jgi:hypothetical protein
MLTANVAAQDEAVALIWIAHGYEAHVVIVVGVFTGSAFAAAAGSVGL